MDLFNQDANYYLPKEYIGGENKNGGYTINNPRIWTKEEIDWALMLKGKGFSNKEIAKYLYRGLVSVSIKLKRLSKKDGQSYNSSHRQDKYKHNKLFLDIINPKTILDLYSGENSYYSNFDYKITTNDLNKNFNCDYNEKAEKLVCKLYYESKKYDLIDVDPFGSAYDCFDLCIKMAKKGIIITLGELGHKRWKRLDFVRRYYNIDTLEEFTTSRIIQEIQSIGIRNKKMLHPVYIRDYKNISRVYFKIENINTMPNQTI